MKPHLDSRSFGLIFVSVAWALFLTIIGSPEILLFTAPVFMLAAPLALGRYPGEGAIEKLSRMARPPSRRRTSSRRIPAAPVESIRGALILASNLAGRAPPVPSA